MLKLLKNFTKKDWLIVAISLLLIIFQVWLDLKLPDYMSEITKLVQTEGSQMSDVLKQGGYMLACAFGSLIAAIVVGYLTSLLSASFTLHVRKKLFENVVHGIFLILGTITVGFVLVITIYLIVSGIPAIAEIGLFNFLFGQEWASTAAEPKFGILPFILSSVYGMGGAILIGVPIGFFTAVFLSKVANKKVKAVVGAAVNLLAGIPSVVYGLVGMLVLVPGIRILFN